MTSIIKSIPLPKAMGYSHQYDIVKEIDATEDEQPYTRRTTPVASSWWKFALCNCIAASVGAAAMYLSMPVAAQQPEPSSSISADVAATSTSLADLTTLTPSFQYIQQQFDNPSWMAGKVLDCGGNPQEARDKGCVFDVMMQDWVPEPCYDSVLTEKYLAQGNWTWYADGEGKNTISDEDMRKGEHGSAWMSTSYHKAHCVFSWLKIVRALRNKRGISQELLSYDHVLHCSHGALNEDSNDEGLGVAAPTNYARCALYDTWILDLIPDEHDSTQ